MVSRAIACPGRASSLTSAEGEIDILVARGCRVNSQWVPDRADARSVTAERGLDPGVTEAVQLPPNRRGVRPWSVPPTDLSVMSRCNTILLDE